MKQHKVCKRYLLAFITYSKTKLIPGRRWALPCPLEGEHCLLKPASICRGFPVSARISSQSWRRGALRSLVEQSTCSQIIVGYITNVKQQEKWSIEGILWEIIDHGSEVELYHTSFPDVTRLLSHHHFFRRIHLSNFIFRCIIKGRNILAMLVKVVVLA